MRPRGINPRQVLAHALRLPGIEEQRSGLCLFEFPAAQRCLHDALGSVRIRAEQQVTNLVWKYHWTVSNELDRRQESTLKRAHEIAARKQ